MSGLTIRIPKSTTPGKKLINTTVPVPLMFYDGKIKEGILQVKVDPKAPDWVKLVYSYLPSMTTDGESYYGTNFLMSGGKKLLFNIYGQACSFEIIFPDVIAKRVELYAKLSTIDSCFLIYPNAWFSMGDYHGYTFFFQKMKYCVEGDLFELFKKRDPKYGTIDKFFNVGVAIRKLHEEGIYPVDIKTENIFLCKCEGEDVFALGDLDDCIVSDENGNLLVERGDKLLTFINGKQMGVTPGYSSSLLFNKSFPTGINKETLEYIDWHAFAQSVIEVFAFYKSTGYDPQSYGRKEEKFITDFKEGFRLVENRTEEQNLIYKCLVLLSHRDSRQFGTYGSRQQALLMSPSNIETIREMNQMMRDFFSEDVKMTDVKMTDDKVKLTITDYDGFIQVLMLIGKAMETDSVFLYKIDEIKLIPLVEKKIHELPWVKDGKLRAVFNGLKALKTVTCRDVLNIGFLQVYLLPRREETKYIFIASEGETLGFAILSLDAAERFGTGEDDKKQMNSMGINPGDLVVTILVICTIEGRKGLGRMLFQKIEDLSQSLGAKALLVSHPTEDAQGFYEKMGLKAEPSEEEGALGDWFGMWYKNISNFKFPSKLPTASTFYPVGTMSKSAKTIYKVSKNKKYAPKGLGSAIKWLQYYLNRGGKGIPTKQRKRIEKAKKWLQRDLRAEKK